MLFVDDKSNLEHASKTWNVVCGIQDKFCAVFFKLLNKIALKANLKV